MEEALLFEEIQLKFREALTAVAAWWHTYSHFLKIYSIYNIIICIYLYLAKGLNFSLTSNISLRRKLKTQAESDFIHILRYSDKILVDDPGEKKCSVGDVRCFFYSGFYFLYFFSGGNTHETGENTHETGENTRNEIFM